MLDTQSVNDCMGHFPAKAADIADEEARTPVTNEASLMLRAGSLHCLESEG